MISFVLPTYNRVDGLRSALSSLLAQTDKDWEALVVVDGTDYVDVIKLLITSIVQPDDKRVKMICLDTRYNDWGHTPRELGKQQAAGKYIIMTGDDNYYVPTFVEEFKKALSSYTQNNVHRRTLPGMVYWDMVHSHYSYNYFQTLPAYNQIDIGAFATRADLAKQLKLNTSYAADGEFVEEFKMRFPEEDIVKINKVLYVHN